MPGVIASEVGTSWTYKDAAGDLELERPSRNVGGIGSFEARPRDGDQAIETGAVRGIEDVLNGSEGWRGPKCRAERQGGANEPPAGTEHAASRSVPDGIMRTCRSASE